MQSSSSSITSVIRQICNEKGIAYEAVLEAINAALASAYKKDFGEKNQNIQVEFDPETSMTKAFDVKTVVPDELALFSYKTEEGLEGEGEGEREGGERQEEGGKKEEEKTSASSPKEEKTAPSEIEIPPVLEGEESETPSTDVLSTEKKKRFNPKTDITLSDAQDIEPDAKVGDEIRIALELHNEFGRMAAQTAKQVITQRLREAERETIYNEYKAKEHTVITGTVQRMLGGGKVLVDLGRATAILPGEEQIERERYHTGTRLKFYIVSVALSVKGPEILLSRTAPEIVQDVFVTEIPEMTNGSVEIKVIAREAGSRSKVAVFTERENIDPIGSCVGQRGARIQTIIAELQGEKIDIIEYNDAPTVFIKNALLPAKILDITINEEEHSARVTVDPDQLSLAIGRGGQNVRLAAKLTGWKITIVELNKGEVKGISHEMLDEATEKNPTETQEKAKDDAPKETSAQETPEAETLPDEEK